jgi:hypothetical protein
MTQQLPESRICAGWFLCAMTAAVLVLVLHAATPPPPPSFQAARQAGFNCPQHLSMRFSILHTSLQQPLVQAAAGHQVTMRLEGQAAAATSMHLMTRHKQRVQHR